MRYTLQNGVDHQYSEKFTDNLRYVLPLLVILAVVAYYGFTHVGSPKRAQNPLTLGIYTIKTPDSGSGSGDSAGTNTNANGAPSTDNSPLSSPAVSAASQSSSPSNLDLSAATSGLQGTIGGRGGGTLPSGGSVQPGAGDVQTSPIPTPSTTPVLPYVYCVPAIDIQTGGKRVLAADGSCVTVN